MEFRLDEAQTELQQTVARFCADRFAFDAIATRETASVDRRVWIEMAALGMFGLMLPEAAGGSGLGAIEAALLFEQLGSHVVPGPVLWTAITAPLVDGAVDGSQLVGGVLTDAVTDRSALVEYAADIDVLVVVHDDGIVAHRTSDLAPPDVLDPLDPLTPVGRFRDLPDREAIGDAQAATELRRLGTALSAAMLAGIASRSLDVARDYAAEREQFGVPIGSFQAVKHMLADMYVRSTLAQSAAYAAAALLDDPAGGDPTRAVAGAKLLAAEAALTNAAAAVQVLGGMGFTWDMLPNFLLKRAWILEQSFGGADDHAYDIGSLLLTETP